MIYHFEELSFQIISVGSVLHEAGHFDVKARPYAAFALRVRGDAKFKVDKTDFASSVGDITYIPAGVAYETVYTEGESLVVHFTNCNYRFCENISSDAFPYLKKIFEQMCRAWEKRAVNEVKSLLYHLLSMLAEGEKTKKDTAFEACMRYMEEHFFDASLTLSRVAGAGYMSDATLRRKFHAYLGVSPKEYLLKMRLSHAVTLLCGGASVKEAAHACGFSDEKFFARTVKKRYGMPPSSFRAL